MVIPRRLLCPPKSVDNRVAAYLPDPMHPRRQKSPTTFTNNASVGDDATLGVYDFASRKQEIISNLQKSNYAAQNLVGVAAPALSAVRDNRLPTPLATAKDRRCQVPLNPIHPIVSHQDPLRFTGSGEYRIVYFAVCPASTIQASSSKRS